MTAALTLAIMALASSIHMVDSRAAEPAADTPSQDRSAEFEQRRHSVKPTAHEVEALRQGDFDAYLERSRQRVERLAALAASFPDAGNIETLRNEIANDYARIGHGLRFHAKDPRRALEMYAASDRWRPFLGGFWIADTLQFDLGDPRAAAVQYRTLLARLNARAPSRNEEENILALWATRWLEHQLAYLDTGKPFNGTIGHDESQSLKAVLFWSGVAGVHDGLDLPRHDAGGAVIRAAIDKLPASTYMLARILPLVLQRDLTTDLPPLRRFDPAGYTMAGLAAFLSPRVDPRMDAPEKTWALMIASLRAGDLETAFACMTPEMRARYRGFFISLTAEKRREVADSFTLHEVTRMEGLAQAAISNKGQGGRVTFINQDGTWLISQM